MTTTTRPADQITEGTRVVADFRQNSQVTRISGTVASLYTVPFHGFDLPMVEIRCEDGRTRYVMRGDVRPVPIERRYVSVLTTTMPGGGHTDISRFDGTLADFVAAFGVPETAAIHDHGDVTECGPDGGTVVVTWYPAPRKD